MQLKIWRFAALLLTALTLAMSMCHLLEMPARMTWDQALWVGSTVHGGLYRMFGTVGGFIVVAANVSAIVVAYLMRGRALAFMLSVGAAAAYFLAFVLWCAVVFPVNFELATWLEGPVPTDWADFRARWETGHAITAMIHLIGFGALLLSVLHDTPPAGLPWQKRTRSARGRRRR